MFDNVDNDKGICAATCNFQKCGILTSVDSDEHVQPLFKFRNCKRCSVSSLTVIVAKTFIRLRVCAGWSEPLMVAHVAAQLYRLLCMKQFIKI